MVRHSKTKLNYVGLAIHCVPDPTCNYCEEGLEIAAHFLCECSHFVTLRQEIWGKSYLHPSEADSVQNLVRFIQKSHRFSQYSSLQIIGVLLGMAYAPTWWSRPAGLYKPRPLLEWNGIHCVPKKQYTKFMAITLSFLYIISKYFCRWKEN